ncbi:hypothetical protein AAC387_Pa03g2967 [Persea americana]
MKCKSSRKGNQVSCKDIYMMMCWDISSCGPSVGSNPIMSHSISNTGSWNPSISSLSIQMDDLYQKTDEPTVVKGSNPAIQAIAAGLSPSRGIREMEAHILQEKIIGSRASADEEIASSDSTDLA